MPAGQAHASLIIGQYVKDSVQTSSGRYVFQTYGNALTGRPESVTVRVKNTGGSTYTGSIDVSIAKFGTGGYTGFVGSCELNSGALSVPAGTETDVTVVDFYTNCGSLVDFTPGNYYATRIDLHAGSGLRAVGSAADTYVAGYAGEGGTLNPSLVDDGTLTGIADIYFVIDTSNTPTPPVTDTTTRIDAVSPYDGETVSTSTPTTFAMDGYLNEDDYREGSRVRLKLDRNTDSQAVGALVAWDAAFGNYTTFPISADGTIAISTTTVEQILGVDRVGLWHMYWEIQSPTVNIFGFTFLQQTLVSTSTTYIYGETTGVDAVQIQQQTILEGLTDAMTDPLSACQFDFTTILDFSASDNLFTCVTTMVSAMVVPNQDQAQQLITGARTSFLEKAPWGYATRIYDIVSFSTATTTLPSIAVTLPAGLPGADEGRIIDFSPWGPIEQAVERIDTTEVATIDGSPLDMFLFWWNTMWLIVFALWVIRELHGAWEAGDFEYDGHSSSAMDKGIYAYRGLAQQSIKEDRRRLRHEQRRIVNGGNMRRDSIKRKFKVKGY